MIWKGWVDFLSGTIWDATVRSEYDLEGFVLVYIKIFQTRLFYNTKKKKENQISRIRGEKSIWMLPLYWTDSFVIWSGSLSCLGFRSQDTSWTTGPCDSDFWVKVVGKSYRVLVIYLWHINSADLKSKNGIIDNNDNNHKRLFIDRVSRIYVTFRFPVW